jgi:hypothetical protein
VIGSSGGRGTRYAEFSGISRSSLPMSIDTGEYPWPVPLGTIPELDAKGVHNTGSMNMGAALQRQADSSSSPRYEAIVREFQSTF